MSGGGAPSFTRTAPADLTPPDWLLARLSTTDRTEYIDRHGFGRAQLRPEWWLKRGVSIHLPSTSDGEPVLARRDLFQIADHVSDDDSLQAFLWHVPGMGKRHVAAQQ
jgi:hypothetical protein